MEAFDEVSTVTRPRESEAEQRFVREAERPAAELADARSRISHLEKLLAQERIGREEAVEVADEARRRHASLLRRRRDGVLELESRLAAFEEECERLQRQLHLAGIQLEHARDEAAWAARPMWRKLLRRASQSH